MKTLFNSRVRIHALFITAVSLAIISCNSNSTTDLKSDTRQATACATIPSAITASWASIRQGEVSTIDAFNNTGNAFGPISINDSCYSDSIIAYLGYSNTPGKDTLYLALYAIENGQVGNGIACIPANTGYGTLPEVPIDSSIHNNHVIAYDTAAQRIENWANDSLRKAYVSSAYSATPSQNMIVAGFIIIAEDLKAGTQHSFYLGLNNGAPDLIIWDQVSGMVIEGPEGVAEDMTVPVPPFPPSFPNE